MALAEPVHITRLIAEEFERLRIPYFVGGSLASSLHGIPRATADVDIVADIKHQHISPLVQSLQETFYIDQDMVADAIRRRSSFNVIHLSTMFKADIFLLKKDAFSREEMVRREKYQVSEKTGEELFLASAEDTILSKLRWFQQGGGISERQWIDVLGVLRVQDKRIDFSYLYDSAKKIGVWDFLIKAIKEAKIK